MQGGQPPRWPYGPGRGIYIARRIVALVVILLLIVLVVPRACQALFGPEEQSSLSVPETTITSEHAANGTEENTVAAQEKEAISDNRSSATETDSESNAGEALYGGEESTKTFNVQATPNLAAVVVISPPPVTTEESAIGSVSTDRIAPPPPITDTLQQEVQPTTNQPAVLSNIAAGNRQEEQTQQATNQSAPILNTGIENQQELQPSTTETPTAFEEPISALSPVPFEGETASSATTTATAGATAAIASSDGAKAVAGGVIASART